MLVIGTNEKPHSFFITSTSGLYTHIKDNIHTLCPHRSKEIYFYKTLNSEQVKCHQMEDHPFAKPYQDYYKHKIQTKFYHRYV